MKTAALVIGIDDYPSQPLTSAVNDAEACKRALLKLNLVGEGAIELMTSAGHPGQKSPTKDNISAALYDIYEQGDALDRFFFFFAGHGLLTFTDAARGRPSTVLLPVDVRNLDRDGSKLLDLDEVLDFMRLAGPQEQFYFVDACRDLAWERHPSVGNLGWAARPPGAARAQATLYAVSELGKALGQQGGMGVMTSYLLEALEGKGVALEYDDYSGDYVVNIESVRNYVKEAIENDPALANRPAYLRQYVVPRLDAPDPKAGPLRVMPAPPPAALTIHIKPDEAAPQTEVSLSLRRVRLAEFCLPPRQNHETIELEPQRYLVEARSHAGSVEPARRVVDLRKTHEVSIDVRGDGPPAPPPPVGISPTAPRMIFSDEAGDLDRDFRTTGGLAMGQVQAEALEPQVAIELEALEPPYRRWSGFGRLQEGVPAGAYRVRFRLGPEVFNETEVYVKAGEGVVVKPTLATTPLVREMLEIKEEIPPSATISESIGDMQAGLLQTMLPIIGIKPFDPANELFHRFDGLIDPREYSQIGPHPFSLVVAVDGDEWPIPPGEILRGIRCRLISDRPLAYNVQSFFNFELRPLAGTGSPRQGESIPGFERIGLAVSRAPSFSFILDLQSPYFGRLRLACAADHKRATVVTVTVRPDRSFAISQNLLRLPGRPEWYRNELVPDVSYGRVLRELQLGQQLYHSGELNNPTVSRGAPLIQELLHARWTDPILSCMAFFSWRRHLRMNPQDESVGGPLLRKTAINLQAFFGAVPDSRLIYGLVFGREAEFDQLLARHEVPVLAEGTRLLASYAEERGREDAPVVEFARRMAVEHIWSLIVS